VRKTEGPTAGINGKVANIAAGRKEQHVLSYDTICGQGCCISKVTGSNFDPDN